MYSHTRSRAQLHILIMFYTSRVLMFRRTRLLLKIFLSLNFKSSYSTIINTYLRSFHPNFPRLLVPKLSHFYDLTSVEISKSQAHQNVSKYSRVFFSLFLSNSVRENFKSGQMVAFPSGFLSFCSRGQRLKSKRGDKQRSADLKDGRIRSFHSNKRYTRVLL